MGRLLTLSIIPIAFGSILVSIFLISYFIDGGVNLPLQGSSRLSFPQAEELASKQIPVDMGLAPSGTWYFHVNSKGDIHYAGDLRHDIIWSRQIACAFDLRPPDGKDHFVYVVKYTNDKVAFVIILDDQTGKVVDTKMMHPESTYCEEQRSPISLPIRNSTA